MLHWLKALVQSPEGKLWAPGVIDRTVSRGLDAWGHVKVSFVTYTGPNPYATGGDAITAQAFKLGTLEFVSFALAVNGVQTVILAYNHATGKVMAFWQTPTAGANAGLQEVDNGTDLSGFVARAIAYGKG